MSLKKPLFILIISFIALLSACGGESAEEKIHNHLEKAVSLEADFEEQQGEITKLEKQEQKLYSQIIDLGMDEFEKIKELSQKAVKVIDQRKEKIKVEKESIEASKEEFNKIKKPIGNLEEQDVKDKAEAIYKLMNNRYKAYDDLYKAYTKSLELEKELYNMLQKEELEQEDLTAQITSINETYEKVFDANDKFNEDTVAYNDLKKDFYKVAEINVTYDDNPSKEKSDKENQ